MGRCFVIQPFDKGAYDKRYEDVIVPAVRDADLEVYRVDRDPATKVLIEAIETGIRECEACIADISTDNPNVWYELGFAIANGKPLVMISNCKERNGGFPFDVSHRSIITYTPESPRDFQRLQDEITRRLRAQLDAAAQTQTMALIESSKTIGGLSPHEIATLRIVMENQLSADDCVLANEVQQQMVKAGFTKIAATISLRRLEKRAFIESVEDSDFNGNRLWSYRMTESGVEWVLSNQEQFQMHRGSSDRASKAPLRDDVPF